MLEAFDVCFTMQEEDWGTYSQASWMTGGAWEDRDKTQRPKKSAKTQLPNLTCVPTTDDQLTQDQTNFYTKVDLADLQMKLQRWTFARNWKTASSSPQSEKDMNISPLSRPVDTDKTPTYPSKNGQSPVCSCDSQTITDNTTPPAQPSRQTTTPPLDEDLMAQYLNQCIAAAETQLAGAKDKSKVKNEAVVKEIERLVEKLVRQAELDG